MKIRIDRLTLEQFKGIGYASYSFGGRDAVLFGRNGTGKSSVCDAWCWLMTGKDSQGRVPADSGGFAIKPLAPDGSVADRAARTVVEAVLDVDGREMVLRKEYYERWTEKRGAAELSYDGNTTDYYIDEVPRSKRQYEELVSELVPLDRLRLLSDVTAFARLPDKERREILFDLAALGDERAILKTDERFAPLLTAMDRLSLADYQKQQQTQRRKLNEQRSHIPARLDEVKQSIAELEEIPFEELRRSAADLEEEKAGLEAQLAGVADLSDPIRLKISELEKQRMALHLENERFRGAQQVSAPDTKGLKRELTRLEVAFLAESKRYQEAQREVRRCEKETGERRSDWRALKVERYPGTALCPTCGQELPSDKQQEAKRAWEEHRQQRLDRAMEEGRRYSVLHDRAKAQLESVKERMIQLENDIARAKDELAEAEAFVAPEVRDLPDYEQRLETIQRELEEQRSLRDAFRADYEEQTFALRQKRTVLADSIRALQAQIAREGTLLRAKERQEELHRQTRDISDRIAMADRMLDLIEQFTRYRAGYVTETINSRFRLARFQLFRVQVNGGLADCCDILYQGVPYHAGLNTGAKINVGLDIISTLSRHYGCSVPVFVDGAESVNEPLMPEEAQCIRLTVTYTDEKVRLETE
ncbi:MAG: AAA family ATPase [Oscillospiraceae bacterium]|nr:AAA family ATPase [Oscillospiraceae bacterium]